MFKDYLIYNNILDNPDKIVEIAKSIAYYPADDNRINGINIINDDKEKPGGAWRGFRSRHLQLIDEQIFSDTVNEIFSKTFKVSCGWNYIVDAYLHYAPGYITYDDNWWHTDNSSVFAGAVYLTKNPEHDTGTIIVDKQEEIKVDNVYNRLVMYKSNIVHRPMRCFGDNIDNSRLTLALFIKRFEFFKS